MSPPDSPNRSPGPALSPLDALAGKRVMLLGTTGFLAKVMLSMLVERFGPAKIICMIRGTRSMSPRERLFQEVLASEMMEPLRERFGAAFEAVVDAQVEALPGDLGKTNLGLDEATLEGLRGQVDVIINSAGLVNFNPQLEQAMVANTVGAQEVARLARDLGAKLVHVSTCYVAGARSGRIREDDPILGSFPKQDEMAGVDFDWQRELSDIIRIIQQVKDRTDDAALESSFRSEALARLKAEGREPHERTVRAAIANQRRRWVTEEQIRLGLERAKHWGWTNIYTYSKALGEQAIAATEGLEWCIVRPAIVESALEYPFPGWNEGMNTSAPLAYLGLNGQVDFPGDNELILDVVPVDFVASTTLAAAAALLEGETSRVYQVAAGDVNPCTMARTITLVGLYKRRQTKAKLERGEISRARAELDMRREPRAITRAAYERASTPLVAKWVRRARGVLDEMAPERYGPLGAAVSRARQKVKEVEDELEKVVDAFDLFMPFIWENRYVFITKNTRGLFSRMNEADQALLPFDTEGLDWRRYWLDVHMPGLERWVFPKLDLDGKKRIAIPRDYRDLAELFDVRTREHGRHIAYRRLGGETDSEAFTFRDVRKAAFAAARALESRGVGEGDRVLLVSEGRPEWGMSYFGIVLGGAVAVPVDIDLSAREIANVARASGAKLAVCSPLHAERLGLLARTYENGAPSNGTSNGASAHADPEPFPVPMINFEVLFADAHAFEAVDEAKPRRRRPEDPASIIYTSGTTGRPKGVVLSHQNFAALTARMSALFDLNRTDAMLSVLPPHHTFEFSAGLLMPLAKGASVTYLEERTPELISRAFDETTVTAMVGVPAVVESLHRKIETQLENLVWPVRVSLRGLIKANENLRDRFGLNLGRALFRPVHAAFGGRLRYLVSGAAPLKPEVFRDLRGLGFGVHEGYGLTEASPVLTVGWPRHKTPAGSVGWPLPGIEVRILDPNSEGVGEVIARGPTIMRGYLDAPEETAEALKQGWLHTGDRGRLDDEGRLFIVGREKDTIIDSSGKNVYPDEIEELYSDHPLIEELSVVGVPAEHGPGERVACLVVPAYATEIEGAPLERAEVRDRIRTHFRAVSGKLPFARRVKLMHMWDHELPRTSTRKVKRTLVRDELMRLERAAGAGRNGAKPARSASPRRDQTEAWVVQTVAAIARRRSSEVHAGSRLVDDLGFDSLMQLELLTTLETERPGARVSPDALAEAGTVAEVVALARKSAAAEPVVEERSAVESSSTLPPPVRALGRAALGLAQRVTYGGMLDVKVEGRGNIPANRNFIVASNHSSHLDMGLVKHALGDFGANLRTLAAKDYFFDEPTRRLYFENFTNLLPMDRHGALKKSLRMASGAIRRGETLLIFPEGTRSRDGVMSDFKPAIGWLSLHERVDVLPMWLGGTHEALPVGAKLPKARELEVRIGDPVDFREMLEVTKDMSRSAAYRYVTREVERRVRALAGLPPRPEPNDPKSPESREEQPQP